MVKLSAAWIISIGYNMQEKQVIESAMKECALQTATHTQHNTSHMNTKEKKTGIESKKNIYYENYFF